MKRTVFILFLMSLLGAFISCQSDDESEKLSVTSRAVSDTPDSICLGLNSAHTYYFFDVNYRRKFSVAFFATYDSVFSADSVRRYHMSDVNDIVTHFKNGQGAAQGVYTMTELERDGSVYSEYNGMLVINLGKNEYAMTNIGKEKWVKAGKIDSLSIQDQKRLRIVVCVFDPTSQRGQVTYAARYAYRGEDKHYFGLSAYRYIYRPADYIDELYDDLKKAKR